ncbi:MAG: DUF2357 domain-containing protein [Actinomycetota bacterium]|nr:DUF2357 domain-containing protein [Actinomycetota bacterium]
MASPATSEAGAPAGVEPIAIGTLRGIVRGVDGRPGLAEVLVRLQQSHRKNLVRVERWTSGDLARHPEPRELIRSRRKPGNLDEHGRLKRVFDARRVLTCDVHENRVVLHAVREVQKALESSDEPEAVELLFELDAAVAQAPYLEDVGHLKGLPGVPTATLAGDPLYRTVYQAWLTLRRSAV